MMIEKKPRILAILLPLFLLVSCKQPETVVVDRTPSSGPSKKQPADTTKPSTAPDFRHLIIGETAPIISTDPLFAGNNATKRFVQLVYEGLVRYNDQGEVIPALADRWEVGEDSLRFTFTLRGNIFYHDSDIFGSGVGRKVTAGDFKYAFERMARNTVPDHAAQLFMAIRGFEPYFREQHDLLVPSRRQLNEVSGIRAPNDSTLTFRLAETDGAFLHKLASPYAVVYPRESVRNSPSGFQPVGTGPFTFSGRRGDSLYILVKNKNYRADSGNEKQPALNRVDIMTVSSEQRIPRLLAEGDLHLVPEMGPATMDSLLTARAGLKPFYSNRFTTGRAGGQTHFQLRYNSHSTTPEIQIRSTLSSADYSGLFSRIPDTLHTFRTTFEADTAAMTRPTTLASADPEDPFARYLLSELDSRLQQNGHGIRIAPVRTPTRNTALYVYKAVPLYKGDRVTQSGSLLRLTVSHSFVQRSEIENLKFNSHPWWIDLRTVTMPGIDRLDKNL